MSEPKRIVLGEKDFQKLVNGEIVEVDGETHIALADIGFDRMAYAFERAMSEAMRKK